MIFFVVIDFWHKHANSGSFFILGSRNPALSCFLNHSLNRSSTIFWVMQGDCPTVLLSLLWAVLQADLPLTFFVTVIHGCDYSSGLLLLLRTVLWVRPPLQAIESHVCVFVTS